MGNRYRRVSLGRRGVYLLYRNCCRSSENNESRYRKVPSEKFSSISFIHGFCTPSFRSAARDLRRRGPLGYFRCECCTGGESVAAARMNRWLVTTHQRRARGCTAHKYGFFFGMTWPGIEPSLPALVVRAQSTRPFYAKIKTIIEMRSLKRGITATAW